MEEQFTIDQISKRLRLTPRTIRYYTKARIFTPPPFRGSETRYGASHLEQLLAIQALRKEGLPLAAIRERFSAAATARQVAEASAASATPAPAPAPSPESPPRPAATAYPAERWDRVVLVPGLELLVRADGGPLLQRLAAEIHAAYGARADGR